MVALHAQRGSFLGAISPHCLHIDKAPQQTQHQPVRSPVRDVEEGVVILERQFCWVAAEVAVVVSIDETGGADLGTRREGPYCLLRGLVQWFVDGQELVILVLAHARPLGASGSLLRSLIGSAGSVSCAGGDSSGSPIFVVDRLLFLGADDGPAQTQSPLLRQQFGRVAVLPALVRGRRSPRAICSRGQVEQEYPHHDAPPRQGAVLPRDHGPP